MSASASFSGRYLPPEYRRPLPQRLPAILADPRAQRCAEPCQVCDAVPPDVTDAALAIWDDLARQGIWPVSHGEVRTRLQTRGMDAPITPLRKLLSHRRFRILSDLVNGDARAFEQTSGAV